MKTLISAVIASVLLLSGCEDVSPAGNGAIFGSAAGALAGGIASAAGLGPGAATAIGLATGAAVGVTVYVVAKHEATERQRMIAEENAWRTYKSSSAPRASHYHHRSRYIAVDTVKESNDKGTKAVMVYDTDSEQIVGNNVYDLKQTPKEGTVAKFDTYSAEYVGGS